MSKVQQSLPIRDSETAQRQAICAPVTGRDMCSFAVIFALALALRLWFNFLAPHPNCYGSCDASEYLRNAGALASLTKLPGEIWQHCLRYLSGSASQSEVELVRSSFSGLAEMHQSGPVFPLFILASYAAFACPFQIENWMPPLAAQSLMSAATCLLIAAIGRYAWNKETGYIAGAMAAIYPPFIINSGRLYSESFAVFLSSLVVLLAVRASFHGTGRITTFLLGASMAALQLTRSATFLLSLVLYALTFLQGRGKHRLLSIFFLTVGFSCVLAPWMAVQHLSFGRSQLIVDRVGHYNFFIGNNTDSLGWLSYPYPDGRGIEGKSLVTLAEESIRKSPGRWLKLMLDKPVRLFKYPWNDFRLSLGFVNAAWQILFHQLLLVLCAAGLSLATVLNSDKPPSKKHVQARLIVAAMLAFHAVYLFFITVPRYNLTAMPFVILFAAAGSGALWNLLHRRKRAPWAVASAAGCLLLVAKSDLLPVIMACPGMQPFMALTLRCALNALMLALLTGSLYLACAQLQGGIALARATVVALSLVCLPALCLPGRAHGRWWEWRSTLTNPGQSAKQTIYLPERIRPRIKQRDCFLLIDAEGARALTAGTRIRANGHELHVPMIPGLALVQDLTLYKQSGQNNVYLECEYIFRCLSESAGLKNCDLRQWFFLHLPERIVDSAAQTGRLEVELTNAGIWPLHLFGGYRTSSASWTVPSPVLYSWEKAFYGVETDRSFSDARYDIKLPNRDSTPEAFLSADPSESQGRQSGNYFMHFLVSPWHSSTSVTTSRDTNSPPARAGKTAPHRNTAGLSLSEAQQADGVWIVHVTGDIRVEEPLKELALEASVKGVDSKGRSVIYTPPWAPYVMADRQRQAHVDFAFPMMPGHFPARITAIEVSRRTSGGARPRGHATFEHLHISIHQLNGKPIDPGYEIF